MTGYRPTATGAGMTTEKAKPVRPIPPKSEIVMEGASLKEAIGRIFRWKTAA